MRAKLQSFLGNILGLELFYRRLIFVLLDSFLIFIAVWCSFWIRLSDYFSPIIVSSLWIFPSFIFFGIIIYIVTGHYKGLSKYLARNAIYTFAYRNLLLIFCVNMFGSLCDFYSPPRSFWFIVWLQITFLTFFVRLFLSDLMRFINIKNYRKVPRVAIYGAGSAGAQLENSLTLSASHKVLNFFDDKKELWYRTLNGIKILPPEKIVNILDELDQILIAIPSIDQKRKKKIISKLQEFNIPVLQIPSIAQITSGREKISKLKKIQIEDLLGRERVMPLSSLMGQNIKNSNVLVTGAGGSIGSELCIKILECSPKKLFVIDQSEFNLYKIIKKIEEKNHSNVFVKYILGDVSREIYIKHLFKKYNFDIVFHAAAYKHVPLVEDNPIEGIRNNIFSTLSICHAAYENEIKQVILISSDKAVRPTNIMGATKRLAEIIIQTFSEKMTLANKKRTCFSMVRFGNVLNSSGSVVPLFEEQISKGGPLTLTDERVTRFFMTIAEASELVIQASSLSLNGDVLLLDMGEPILIKFLAEQMIKLSGLTLKNDNNNNGDIEIITTGLRPGEKLYEELLIDAEAKSTIHPLIFKAKEEFIYSESIFKKIDSLKNACENNDKFLALKLLHELVPEWENIFQGNSLRF